MLHRFNLCKTAAQMVRPVGLKFLPGNHALKRAMSGLSIDRRPEGVAILRMDSPPINTLTEELLGGLREEMVQLAGDNEVKAVVLASDLPGAFSVGLERRKLIHSNERDFKEYWQLLQDVYRTVYSFPKPVVAAVTGEAHTGGAMLVLASDYAIMTQNKEMRLGFNEVHCGIPPPLLAVRHFMDIIGRGTAERYVKLGQLVTAEQALKDGLIAGMEPSVEATTAASIKAAEQLAKIPAFSHAKLAIREGIISDLRSFRFKEANQAWGFLRLPEVRDLLMNSDW